MASVPFDSDLTKLEPWASDTMSRTDLPRLRAGKVFARLIMMKTISMVIIININWVNAEFWSADTQTKTLQKKKISLFDLFIGPTYTWGPIYRVSQKKLSLVKISCGKYSSGR